MRLPRSLLPVLWVVLALVAGAAFGLVGGPAAGAVAPLSKLLIQAIKAAATPLVFFAVMEAILLYKVSGQDVSRLLAVVLTNGAIAISIGMLVAGVFEPGQYLGFLRESHADVPALSAPDLPTLIQKQIPTSVASPFVENDILGAVLVAFAIGLAWRTVQRQGHAFSARLEHGASWVSAGRAISELVLTWIVKLVPVAVFAATAKVTAQHGLSPFKGLGQYVLLCLLGMALHVTVTYSAWLLLVARIGLVRFWRAALEPIVCAFSVNSSLVALPLTLRALDTLGISRRASTLTACVGTNLNNDGIILYEGFTLLALAQAFGVELSLGAQISAAVYCAIAAMGVAGVPEAGVVALTLVLGAFGLPTEALALLLSVDWLIARCRSLLNVSSDMIGATVLQRFLPDAQAADPDGVAPS